MVTTGRLNSQEARVAKIKTAMGPGMVLASFLGQSRMAARQIKDIARVGGSTRFRLLNTAPTEEMKPESATPGGRPKKSFNWVEKISMAMPLVKPLMSG